MVKKKRYIPKKKQNLIPRIKNGNATTKIEIEKSTNKTNINNTNYLTKTYNLCIRYWYFSLSLLFAILTLIFWIQFNNSSLDKLVVVIQRFNNIHFDEKFRNDNPTSPLCGCLDDSVHHDGTLIPANSCTIENKPKNSNSSNFLITCPDESEIGPRACFSFNAEIYRLPLKQYLNYKTSELCELIESNSNIKPSQSIKNETFFSIITSNNIEVFSNYDSSLLSFIGSALGSTTIQKNKDKYEGTIDNIKIIHNTAKNNIDSLNKVACIDFCSNKVFIKWIDSLEILTQNGSSIVMDRLIESLAENQKKPISIPHYERCINIAVIKPVNNIRFSILPWSKNLLKYWERDYYTQFGKSGDYLFFGYHPIINCSTGEPILLTELKIKPFSTPALINDESEITINVNSLYTEKKYEELSNYFMEKEGYYYKHDSVDFELGRSLDITNAVIDTNFMSYYNQALKSSNAHEILYNMRKLNQSIDMKKTKDAGLDTIKYKSNMEYFRYPPLQKRYGLSAFIDFTNIEFSNCYGFVLINNKKHSFENQNLKIVNLHDSKLEYPSLLIALNDKINETVIEGNGTIKIDNIRIKNSLLENWYIQLASTLATIVSFIIGVFDLIRKRMKK